MQISRLKTNHLVNPLGFDLGKPRVSFMIEDAWKEKNLLTRVVVAMDKELNHIVYDSGFAKEIDGLAHEIPLSLKEQTRYYWQVSVKNDCGEIKTSDLAWFETAKTSNWQAKWISPDLDKNTQVTLHKKLEIQKEVKKARIYMLGLGVYELYINHDKVGDEYLQPGIHSYDSWLQYQTYEVTVEKGNNIIEVMLGNGWYKGDFGLTKEKENYGDQLACIAEIHIWYEDGTKEIISTDESWKARKSKVVQSGIYSGEVFDDTLESEEDYNTQVLKLGYDRLTPRLSPPLRAQERIEVEELIITPKKELVLDFGQNMVGWVEFTNRIPEGEKVKLQFGEILQEGNFYRDNLRTAQAEFVYISDGQKKQVRPHFTFYGFRYVKVEGWPGEVDKKDFTGIVIHSDLEEIGEIETSNPLINQLFKNAKWGQKGNFLDIPTDCPQRDERMGWTGDAQIFSGTACYNTDAYAFYQKYGKDIYCEQLLLNGSVPDVVPRVHYPGHSSTAWGDAATIIPWNVYLHYGDKDILVRQYDSMKAWVEYMKGQDDKYGGKRLWQSGFHYADWLALDGPVEGGVYGATDPFLISSGYYYYSTNILAKTAEIIDKKEEENKYKKLAKEIKEAFIGEYYSPAGRLCVDTMTAYVVVLYMDLVPDFAFEKVKQGLLRKLQDYQYHLCTGFVGTPYLCQILSQIGYNDLAYKLLLQKDYPSWLYQVEMGATTVWERWNSVLADGSISGTEMNSLNHYAYGSIVEWMYAYMVGLKPDEDKPGFKRALISPQPNYRLKWARGKLASAAGVYEVKWEQVGEKLKISVWIPQGCEGRVTLPDCDRRTITGYKEAAKIGQQEGTNVILELRAGYYEFIYQPTIALKPVYSIESLLEDLLASADAKEILNEKLYAKYGEIPFGKETPILRDILNSPFIQMPYEKQEELDRLLRNI